MAGGGVKVPVACKSNSISAIHTNIADANVKLIQT